MKGEDESRFGHLGSLICLLFGSESLGILADKNDVIGICAEWWNLVACRYARSRCELSCGWVPNPTRLFIIGYLGIFLVPAAGLSLQPGKVYQRYVCRPDVNLR